MHSASRIFNFHVIVPAFTCGVYCQLVQFTVVYFHILHSYFNSEKAFHSFGTTVEPYNIQPNTYTDILQQWCAPVLLCTNLFSQLATHSSSE